MMSATTAVFASEELNFVPENQNKRKNLKVGTIATYVVLLIYSVWILAPFIVILVTSFTTNEEYAYATGYIWWPEDFSLVGYKLIFTEDPFMTNGVPSLLSGFINTMWMTLLPLVSSLFQSLVVAYCYAKYDFLGKKTLFTITIALMFVPLGAFGFVGYMFYQNIGWTDGYMSILPMVVPGMFASVGTLFFLRPYLDGIGSEMIEAAKIDGMGFWQILFTIIIPLAKPAIIVQFIFGFVGGYNNYSTALMYLGNNSSDIWTLQLSLQQLISYFSTSPEGDYNLKCATALMSMLPLIILYLACQKFFLEGISFGGSKE